jgi:hypothetical protein
MKKIALFLVILLAVCWWLYSHYSNSALSASALAVHGPEPVKASAATRLPTPLGPIGAPASPMRSPPASSFASSRGAPPPAAESNPSIKMSLAEVLGPDNVFHDGLTGVSVKFPEDWVVRDAIRWGQDHRENTVFFNLPEGTAAVPSMYYQPYPNGAPAPGEAEAMLRSQAEQKEASRSDNGSNDYKNDPDSFVFRTIDGHPTLSYFATYTRGDAVQAEYFTRILGDNGYVMFFVRGPAKDVQALIPAVSQMSTTVKPP